MDIAKFNFWIFGTTLVFGGTILLYLQNYRNNEIVGTISYLLLFFGWVTLFVKATKGTAVDAKKIAFKSDNTGWFKQRASILLYYCIFFALLFGNGYYATEWGRIRKNELLANGQTNTTEAVVSYIEIRHHRSSNSYYAVFHYTVDGKTIIHPWYERKEDDFTTGDKYYIKYVIGHPEMMMILQKMP